MAKEFAKQFYKSSLWQTTREYILNRDNGLCQRCGKVATDVHHIIHLTPENIDDKAVCVNPDNLISLCSACHKTEHYYDRNGLDQCVFNEKGEMVGVIQHNQQSPLES